MLSLFTNAEILAFATESRIGVLDAVRFIVIFADLDPAALDD